MPENARAFFQEMGRIGGRVGNRKKGFAVMDAEKVAELSRKGVIARLARAEKEPKKEFRKKLLTPRA